MPEQTTHPSHEQLSAYNCGQLPPDEAVLIETHISDCEPCCETIVGLSSDDTFIRLLKESRQLQTDETVDVSATAATTSAQEVPAPLAGHPRYEIVGLIGRGGMGDVYKATHRKMERTVALKVINRGLVQKTEVVDRFHREVRAAAQLSHPNIVTAFDADQADDFHFMVMEYVDGVDLSQTVKDRGALPVAEACEYIRQAAIGLQHAHEQGMVHRDIKPHNLMVTADGTVKVLDFGLASLAPEAVPDVETVEARGDLTAAGAIMGTPDFISPEQADDARKADIRSDIYSLGATLYFLLSGQPPFADGSVMHKLKSHAQAEPEPLESLRDDVPRELVAVVTKMTAKDPDERYLTPREVADALESFLRTWRPEEAESHGQEPSNDGNMSGSVGQTSGANNMSPDWIPVLGKWLFYLSLIPIALLVLDTFFWTDGASDAPDRTMFYIGTSVALSTIGGILAGVHQFNTGRREDHRENRWPEGQTMLIGAILVGAGTFYLFETDHGVVRIEVNDPSLQISILGQTITMEDGVEKPLTITPGEWPLLVSKEDAGFRFHTDSFKIRRGDEITFKVEVLNDEIVVLKDGEPFDRQEIFDLRRELQDAEDRSPADGNQLATASTSSSRPELKITGKTVNKGTAGLPSVYDWNCKGRDVGNLKVRLLLAQNGKANVIQEFDFEELPAEFDNKVRLEVRDDATGADRKRRVNAILYVESPVPSRSATINENKGLSISIEAPFSNRIERADLGPIDRGQTELLLAWSFWKGDMNHGRSMESMTAATKSGNATFLFVTLDWKPIGEVALGLLQGDWETESLTESEKQLANENGFGGLLLQIKGNTFVIGERKPNGEKSEVNTGRIEINTTTSPRTIDFIGRAQRHQRTLGIYELKDGVLRICLAGQGGPDAPAGAPIPDTKPLKRPTTFDSPAGSNIMLMEFTRNEPAKENDTPNIQGTWQVTYSEDGGRIAPQEMLKEIRFVIDERNLTTEIGGRKSVSTYKLDPSTNPKSIDLTENGRTKQAIYDLVGDTLRICIAESGEQRPTAFDSQPNSANDIILILKRVKPGEATSADTGDHLHAGPMSPKLARLLIPEAASISHEDFQKLQTNPSATTVENKSLSLVLMTLDIGDQSPEATNDFRFLVEGYPKPSKIAAAMSSSRSKGYFSIIQPEYITECRITNSTDEMAQGKVTFNAPKLYIGSVTFEARKHEGKWRIEKFHLPSRQISIVPGEDGDWQWNR